MHLKRLDEIKPVMCRVVMYITGCLVQLFKSWFSATVSLVLMLMSVGDLSSNNYVNLCMVYYHAQCSWQKCKLPG